MAFFDVAVVIFHPSYLIAVDRLRKAIQTSMFYAHVHPHLNRCLTKVFSYSEFYDFSSLTLRIEYHADGVDIYSYFGRMYK